VPIHYISKKFFAIGIKSKKPIFTIIYLIFDVLLKNLLNYHIIKTQFIFIKYEMGNYDTY
jgi:hypothetical protein